VSVTLFRQQAVDHQRLQIWGEVALALPASYALVTAFIALSVFIACLFVATQTYGRKEHATGFLLPTSGVARITPPRAGTISAVSVVEGQHVERGTPLLTVADTATSERGENIDSAKIEELRKQRGQLTDQIALEQGKATIEAQRLQSQIDNASQQVTEFGHQLTIQADRIEIAAQQLKGATELAGKGFLSKVELRQRKDAYLSEQENHSSLLREQAAKQAELAGLRDTLRQLPMSTVQRVSQLDASITEIDTRLKEIEAQRGYQIQAPIAGQVSTLQAWIGKSVDQKIPLLSVVPDGDVLEAELLIPARAIGFVAVGQTVRLSYDAFPFAQFGFARGTVRSVSHTVLKPDELVGPAQLHEPSYPVYVALDRQTIRAYGAELPLQPDLQLQADVVTERRSLVSWILDPVFSVWRRS
jgi:membrane fusion protein